MWNKDAWGSKIYNITFDVGQNCSDREKARENPKIDQIESLFLVFALKYTRNEYCKWQEELDMLDN